MRTLKIYKEHLHALLYSIKKGSINHFFFKLSSFMRKRFREDPYYNQLTKIKKRTSKVTHWSEIEDPKPKLSKVSIALPSQIMNIEEDIDWNISFKDKEDEFSLHRFGWLLTEVSNKRLSKKEGFEFINHWIISNQDHKRRGWDSYSISERLMNWFIVYRQIFSELKEDDIIRRSTYRQLEHLIRNIEIRGTSTNNHLLNNGRCILIAGILLRDEELITIGDEILETVSKKIIGQSGMSIEGSSHYQILIARTFMEILWFSKMYKKEAVLEKYEPISKRVLSAASFFLQSKSFPLIGDISPDFKYDFFDDLPIAAKHILDSNIRNEFNEELTGWAYFFGINSNKLGLNNNLGADNASSLTNTPDPYFPKSGIIDEFSKDGYMYFSNSSFGMYLYLNPENSVMPGTHKHSDLLSFILTHMNRSLIIDTGRQSYQRNKISRFGQSIIGHNGIRIDRREPQIIHGLNGYPELLDDDYLGKKPQIELSSDQNKIKLINYGYNRISHDIIVTRTLELNGNEVIIIDEISGSSKHLVETFFHFDTKTIYWNENEMWFDIEFEGIASRIIFNADCTQSVFQLINTENLNKEHLSLKSEYYGEYENISSLVFSQKKMLPITNRYSLKIID